MYWIPVIWPESHSARNIAVNFHGLSQISQSEREFAVNVPFQHLSIAIQKIFASLSSASSLVRRLINFHSIISPVGKRCRCQWTIISKAVWENAVENAVNQKPFGISDNLGISISISVAPTIEWIAGDRARSTSPFGESWPWTLVGVIYEARGT